MEEAVWQWFVDRDACEGDLKAMLRAVHTVWVDRGGLTRTDVIAAVYVGPWRDENTVRKVAGMFRGVRTYLRKASDADLDSQMADQLLLAAARTVRVHSPDELSSELLAKAFQRVYSTFLAADDDTSALVRELCECEQRSYRGTGRRPKPPVLAFAVRGSNAPKEWLDLRRRHREVLAERLSSYAECLGRGLRDGLLQPDDLERYMLQLIGSIMDGLDRRLYEVYLEREGRIPELTLQRRERVKGYVALIEKVERALKGVGVNPLEALRGLRAFLYEVQQADEAGEA